MSYADSSILWCYRCDPVGPLCCFCVCGRPVWSPPWLATFLVAQKTEDVAVAEELQKKEDRSPLKLWDNFSLWRGECKECCILYFMYICRYCFCSILCGFGVGMSIRKAMSFVSCFVPVDLSCPVFVPSCGFPCFPLSELDMADLCVGVL